MIRARRLAALSLVAFVVVCLGLAWNAMTGALRAGGEDDPRRLEVSSIDLSGGKQDAILSARDMLPGDAVTAAVTVANSGRQPMTYGMSHGPMSADGARLSAALVLTIRTVGSSCADHDGVILFEGPLDQAAFGAGGDARPLPPATAEILCFRIALPVGADNELQRAATTVSLSFGARRQAALA